MNNRRFWTTLILAGMTATSNAGSDAVRLSPKWQALDRNGDGTVSIAELHPLQAGAMRLHDADADGNISLEEYVNFDLDPGGALKTPLPKGIKLIENVAYAGTDDPRQALDIYLPKIPVTEGPIPVIAYIHGGGFSVGSKVSARSQMLPLVSTGRFAAVSIGYRLSWQSQWPSQIHDIKAGIRWIRAHAADYGLDPQRICAFGPSAGGHLAAMLGVGNGVESLEGELGDYLHVSSDVQCAVDYFGPSDLRTASALDPLGNPSPETKLLGGSAAQKPELAANASPVVHVDSGDMPFYIVHGTADPLVPYSHSVTLAAALKDAGVPTTFQTIVGGKHGDFGAAQDEATARTAAFLEQQLYAIDNLVPHDNLKVSP